MKTRSEYALINSLVGVFGQIIQILLSFLTRTIFIYYLGKELLGIDSLFTNILSILSISELGLNTAIVYSLYNPILKKDKDKIAAYMNIYKKCYFYIGWIIFILGLLVLCNIQYFVNVSILISYIRLVFALYLFNIMITYWGNAYKSSILIADQKSYINTSIVKLCFMMQSIIQIFILMVCKSILLYSITTLIFSIVRNIAVSKVVDRLYPYLSKRKNKKIENQEKKELVKNVIGMSAYKISSTISSSTDNLIISKFINIEAVGIYSNYILIISSVKMVINSIFSSITASIGNLNAENDIERNYNVFRIISFLCFVFYCISSVCLFTLLNKFIKMWIGNDFLLVNKIVFIIILDFLTDGLQRGVILYKDACGLFWKGKFRPLFSAFFNLIISLLLVKKFSLLGVIFGTIISRFLTTWWYDPILIYKNVFKKDFKEYFKTYILYLIISLFLCIFTYSISLLINIRNVYLSFITTATISLLIPALFILIFFYKKKELKTLISMLMTVYNKKRSDRNL